MFRFLTLIMAILVLSSCTLNHQESEDKYNQYVKSKLDPKYPKDRHIRGYKGHPNDANEDYEPYVGCPRGKK